MPHLDPERDIHAWLAHHEQKELLRFVTVGSVDDGKSTLIGRLLHDTAAVFDDQLAAVRRATVKKGAVGEDEEIDFSLFTDGLAAEREQGITIDVAYRYFATERRKYILADTPGHVQYTRNMATGASTADVAIILLDARLGVLPQSRRHAYIASLLRIPELVVAVNKMDLVDFDRAVFERLRDEFGAFVARLGFERVTFVPMSARRGDNVARPSDRTPWYEGPDLLAHLEHTPLQRADLAAPLRFPIQYVLRPHLDYRAFAGTISSGVVRPGDRVEVLPSRRQSTVRAVELAGEALPQAIAPMSVAIRLDDEVDVARGDMIVHLGRAPMVRDRFVADVVWMSERASDPGRSYLVKHTTRVTPARVERVLGHTDLESLATCEATTLSLNDIGRVVVRCARPLFLDDYRASRATGAFILVDALSNETVAAGMIRDEEPLSLQANEARFASHVSPNERAERLGHGRAVAWVTAPPDARGRQRGVALLAATELALHRRGIVSAVCIADGDAVADRVLGVTSTGAVAIALAPATRTAVRAVIRDAGCGPVVAVGQAAGEGDDALSFPSDDADVDGCAERLADAIASAVRGAPDRS